jgi:SAM-dependent MidA family methyltransferase
VSSAAAPDLLRFDEFMELALYGPSGFYSSGGAAGRRGDFLTSPEVGPLFGAVVARAIDAEWRRQGSPGAFDVIDAGAGPGTLARSVLAAKCEAQRAGALRYTCVEASAAQRERHPEGVVSVAEMPQRIECGFVIANELFDNLPFRLAVWDGEWREAFVAEQSGRWVEVLIRLDEIPSVLPRHSVPLGSRAPLQDRASQWLGSVLSSMGRGRVVVIDYCTGVTASLAMRPWREWLRTYRQQQRGTHYLSAPGSQDITAEVCIDQLALGVGEADAIRSQAQWLQLWGIDELVDEGRHWWEENASAPDLRAMTGRSRVREAEALCDPAGLGAFTVLEWVAGP